MNKSVIIALLVGIIVGQFSLAHADTDSAITRHDLFEAAALAGICANANYRPAGVFGHAYHGPEFFRAKAKGYADAL